jgi:thiol-disulfide isomerase/thioredoxin
MPYLISPGGRVKRLLLMAFIGLGVVLGVLYGTNGLNRNHDRSVQQAGHCTNAAKLAQSLKPLATGALAALAIRQNPEPIVDIAFTKPDGTATRLSDFKGKTLLVNLWATWCAPCREEMPALDRLQAGFGGPHFEVVAINIDQRNLEKVRHFLEEANITRLTRYADPSAKVFSDLKSTQKAFGMPTTLLIDPQGCELANLAGPADWAGQEARSLIAASLKQPGS